MVEEKKKDFFHVFIIPDGNRRWAKEKGLPFWEGHKKGYDVFESIVRSIWKMGVTHLTAWGLSMDNFKNRSDEEISFLCEIIGNAMDTLFDSPETEKEKICVRTIGRWETIFPNSLQNKIKKLQSKTAPYSYSNKNLTFLLGYNGDDELSEAVSRLHRNKLIGEKITYNNIRTWLWSWFLPDVDIMIRTGFEPHLSAGALLIQMTNAHLSFPQMHFPDFSSEELAKIIDDYKNRERRNGA